MPGRDPAVCDDGQGHDAGHALEGTVILGALEDLVVGNCDGFTNTLSG